MSNSLRPHESQHARPPCPSPSPGIHSDSCVSSQWCHPAISSLGEAKIQNEEITAPPPTTTKNDSWGSETNRKSWGIFQSITIFNGPLAALWLFWGLLKTLPSSQNKVSYNLKILWWLNQQVSIVCMRAKSLQSYLTLCNCVDCSPPGSSVHGILQARILEWVAMPSSRGSSRLRIEPVCLMSPALAGGFFIMSATWEAQVSTENNAFLLWSHHLMSTESVKSSMGVLVMF